MKMLSASSAVCALFVMNRPETKNDFVPTTTMSLENVANFFAEIVTLQLDCFAIVQH